MPKKAKTQAQKIADGRRAAELPEIMNEAMIAIDEDLTSGGGRPVNRMVPKGRRYGQN